MKKTYKVELLPWYDWSCTVEIDEAYIVHITPTVYTARDAIKDMVEFWSDWEWRLSNNDGDYTKTFLQDLAWSCYYQVFAEKNNLHGVIRSFHNKEGWASMDGSFGIRVIAVDEVTIESSDFEVKEIVKEEPA